MTTFSGLRLSLEQYPGLPEEAFCPTCRSPLGDHPAITARLRAQDIDPSTVMRYLCGCERARQERAARRAEVAAIPADKSFDSFVVRPKHRSVQQGLTAALLWAAGGGKPILVLSGKPGMGKSHLAAAAAQVILERGERVMYREEKPFLRYLQTLYGPDSVRGASDEAVGELCTVPWLILDDHGLTKRTEWVDALLDDLIHARWRDAGRLRTLVTTNAGPDGLSPRVADRLQDHQVAATCVIDASSYRIGGA